jgi:hypothetical protein
MTPSIPVNIATEDEISEVVSRRLLEHANRSYAVGTAYGRTGFGYLRRLIPGWNQAAQGVPFILMTDLDQYPCPPALIDDWLNVPKHPNLLIRVAVREIEAWLLADRTSIAKFLRVSRDHVPADVEALPDPKATLVSLARRSRSRSIRERVAPRTGSTAHQGPDYNGCLAEYVSTLWDIDEAADVAPSLSRAMTALRIFTPVWP